MLYKLHKIWVGRLLRCISDFSWNLGYGILLKAYDLNITAWLMVYAYFIFYEKLTGDNAEQMKKISWLTDFWKKLPLILESFVTLCLIALGVTLPHLWTSVIVASTYGSLFWPKKINFPLHYRHEKISYLLISSIVTSLPWRTESSSCWTLSWTSGFKIMYSVAHDSVAATVSFPAMNRSITVALSFGTAKDVTVSEWCLLISCKAQFGTEKYNEHSYTLQYLHNLNIFC